MQSGLFTTEELVNHILTTFEKNEVSEMELDEFFKTIYPGTEQNDYWAAFTKMIKINILRFDNQESAGPTTIALLMETQSARIKWMKQTSFFLSLKAEVDDLLKEAKRPFDVIQSIIAVAVASSWLLPKYIGTGDTLIVLRDLVLLGAVVMFVRFFSTVLVKIKYHRKIAKSAKENGYHTNHVKVLAELLF